MTEVLEFEIEGIRLLRGSPRDGLCRTNLYPAQPAQPRDARLETDLARGQGNLRAHLPYLRLRALRFITVRVPRVIEHGLDVRSRVL